MVFYPWQRKGRTRRAERSTAKCVTEWLPQHNGLNWFWEIFQTTASTTTPPFFFLSENSETNCDSYIRDNKRQVSSVSSQSAVLGFLKYCRKCKFGGIIWSSLINFAFLHRCFSLRVGVSFLDFKCIKISHLQSGFFSLATQKYQIKRLIWKIISLL